MMTGACLSTTAAVEHAAHVKLEVPRSSRYLVSARRVAHPGQRTFICARLELSDTKVYEP